MALMRTSNPALNAKTFADVRRDPTAPSMTVEGTVNRTAFLLFLVVLPAAWVWAQVRTALDPSVAGPWIMVGAIGGLVVAFITISSTSISSSQARPPERPSIWSGTAPSA